MKPLITEKNIRRRIRRLAIEIVNEMGRGEETAVIALLDGSFMFLADLIRELYQLDFPLTVNFIGVSSYQGNTRSSGRLSWYRRPPLSAAERRVLLVDDILDTGLTLNGVQQHLLRQNPTVLKTCVLLKKSKTRSFDNRVDFTGFTIPDVFVAGYGLDMNGRYRELPYIAAMTES